MGEVKLSRADIDKVVAMIKVMNPVKWVLIEGRIETDLGIKISRQALNSSPGYERVRKAYKKRKQELRGIPSPTLISYTKGDMEMARKIEEQCALIDELENTIEKQRAFISEIAETAKDNPAVREVLGRVKHKILRSTQQR
ncbi:hypothetical protein KUW04_08830 [Halomonas denitrificans]|nr:hypothetical protein [Halomonas denitrificans]